MEKDNSFPLDFNQSQGNVCSICGKNINLNECLNLSASWPTSKSKLLERWFAHICENCVDEKLTFVKFEKVVYKDFDHFIFDLQ